jgi:hypothetical protein
LRRGGRRPCRQRENQKGFCLVSRRRRVRGLEKELYERSEAHFHLQYDSALCGRRVVNYQQIIFPSLPCSTCIFPIQPSDGFVSTCRQAAGPAGRSLCRPMHVCYRLQPQTALRPSDRLYADLMV